MTTLSHGGEALGLSGCGPGFHPVTQLGEAR